MITPAPIEVYETPQTLFAAQFIGSPAMNIFDGEIDVGKLTLANGAKLDIDTSFTGPVKAGIRPEHLHVEEQGSMAIDVKYAEPLGATTLLHGTLTDSNIDMVVSVPGVYRMKHKTESGVEAMDRVVLQPQHVHLFDSDTGKRVN